MNNIIYDTFGLVLGIAYESDKQVRDKIANMKPNTIERIQNVIEKYDMSEIDIHTINKILNGRLS